MRIRKIETIPLAYSFDPQRAYGMSRGTVSRRSSTIVRIHTDDGREGIGESWGPAEVVAREVELFAPAFVGQEPCNAEGIMHRVLNSGYHQSTKGIAVAALSGIETACWDLMGKATGLPVCKLLGGRYRDEVQAYASDGYVRVDGYDFEKQVAESLEGGFRALKIKIGTGLEEDVRRVRIARKALGPGGLLMVDVNGNYTADVAIRCAQRIEEHGIHWYEEPVPPDDLNGFARLKEHCSIPVATGEAEFMRYGFRELISRRLVDIVQPDVAAVGGLGETMTIARMAAAWHVRVEPHVWGTAVLLAASLQLLAAIPDHPHTVYPPQPRLLELDRADSPLRDRLLQEPIRAVDGCVKIPDGPGLGIVLDEAALAKYRIG